MEKKNGTFYGIGVGCGDPTDLTTRAIEILNACPIIVLPSGSRAYDIVESAIPSINAASKHLIKFNIPMTHDQAALTAHRKEIYGIVKMYLSEGKDVGFVTIGDTLIYSTFSYIKEYAEKDGFDIQVISGIPSFLSCAAKLGLVLGQDDEEVHIIPGSADIDKAIELSGMKIFMKLGKHFPELKNALVLNPEHKFLGAVFHCGMSDEKIIRDISEVPSENSYLMTAFVK